MLLYEEGDERKKRAEICLPFKWQNHIPLIGTAVLHGQMRKRQMTFIPNSSKFLIILMFMILFFWVIQTGGIAVQWQFIRFLIRMISVENRFICSVHMGQEGLED